MFYKKYLFFTILSFIYFLPILQAQNRELPAQVFTPKTPFLTKIIENKNDIANGKIYNIGNPSNNHSIKELAKMMMDIAHRVPEYQASAKQVVIQETTSKEYYGTGYQDVQNRVPKIDNTMQELDWKPETNMANALEHIFEAYRHDVVKARHLVDH